MAGATRPPLPDWHAPSPDAITRDPITPDRASVQAWLDAYVRAWQSYAPAAIADLWTEEALWIYPFGVRARGRAAIIPRVVREAPGRRSSSRPAQPPAIGGMTCTRSPSRNGAPRTAVAPLTTKM